MTLPNDLWPANQDLGQAAFHSASLLFPNFFVAFF